MKNTFKISTFIILLFTIYKNTKVITETHLFTEEENNQVAQVMNNMEFNFIEYHGLKIKGKYFKEDVEDNHIPIVIIDVLDGQINVCKIRFERPFQEFKNCHQNKSCYDQVEKCAMKYDREQKKQNSNNKESTIIEVPINKVQSKDSTIVKPPTKNTSKNNVETQTNDKGISKTKSSKVKYISLPKIQPVVGYQSPTIYHYNFPEKIDDKSSSQIIYPEVFKPSTEKFDYSDQIESREESQESTNNKNSQQKHCNPSIKKSSFHVGSLMSQLTSEKEISSSNSQKESSYNNSSNDSQKQNIIQKKKFDEDESSNQKLNINVAKLSSTKNEQLSGYNSSQEESSEKIKINIAKLSSTKNEELSKNNSQEQTQEKKNSQKIEQSSLIQVLSKENTEENNPTKLINNNVIQDEKLNSTISTKKQSSTENYSDNFEDPTLSIQIQKTSSDQENSNQIKNTPQNPNLLNVKENKDLEPLNVRRPSYDENLLKEKKLSSSESENSLSIDINNFPALKLVKEYPISYSSDEYDEPQKKQKIEDNKPFEIKLHPVQNQEIDHSFNGMIKCNDVDIRIYKQIIGELMVSNSIINDSFYEENVINCHTNIKRSKFNSMIKKNGKICMMNVIEIDFNWLVKDSRVSNKIDILYPEDDFVEQDMNQCIDELGHEKTLKNLA